MARARKKVEAPNESMSVVNMFVLIFSIFVGAFWRLLKAAYVKESTPLRNVVIDILAVGFILTIMGFCHYWRGIVYVGSYLSFIGMVAMLRHSNYQSEGYQEWMQRNHPEEPKPKVKLVKLDPTIDYYAAPKVDFSKPYVPDYSGKRMVEVDEKELAKWLNKNPDLAVDAQNQ